MQFNSANKITGKVLHVWASLVAQTLKNPPAMWETWVQSLGWEALLEEGMANHSSILAWRIPWTEEPGGLWSVGRKEADMTEQLSTAQHMTSFPDFDPVPDFGYLHHPHQALLYFWSCDQPKGYRAHITWGNTDFSRLFGLNKHF